MAQSKRQRSQPAARTPRAPADVRPSESVSHPPARRRHGLLLAGFGLLVGIGLLFARPWSAHGNATPGAPGHGAPEEAPVSADPIRAEFDAVAKRLFTEPGGWMERTASTRLQRTIEDPRTPADKVLLARCDLVKALLKEAHEQQAVQEVETVMRAVERRPGLLEHEPNFHRLRATAYLRLAEVQNCVARHNNDCCVFPLQGGGVHTEGTAAREAAVSYVNYLKARPADLAGRWLLNIVHMAQGTYPDGVPEEYRVPEKGPGSSDDFPRFLDVSQASGITRRNHAGGCVVDDIDGDGRLDIVLSSCAPDAPLACYRNEADGTFREQAGSRGLANQLGGLNLVSTDYDNDGDLDLFVLRGAWLYDEGRIRKSLLQNDGTGRFTDVTRAAGLADTQRPSQVGVWFDFDNDGDLDLFLGNESRADHSVFTTERNNDGDYPSNLFRNEGNGTFTDVARQAGVTNDRFCKGATAGDYDNDGWVDLYVSNIGKNRLYRNNRDGTFRDVAEELGVVEPAGRSFATWFFDYDNDGHLDLYVSAYDTLLDDAAAWQLGLPFKTAPPRLYRNRGDGSFEDVTRAAGLWRPMQTMGANFGDLDNDGWLDLYLTTGNPEYEALVPNVMLRNAGGGRFEDVTVAGGFGNLQKGHGVAFADLDDDGDQDVFNELGGFFRGDAYYNSLYENPGSANRFLSLKLVGTRTNKLGYGARIRVVVRTPLGERTLHRAVGSVSSFGGSPARQEIGLGDALAIESVTIRWPASGVEQVLTGLELDGRYEVTEGAAEVRKLAPQAFKLGGPAK